MKITILGSTGTIGINTLFVISKLSKKYQIFALTAQTNYKLLFNQIKLYKPTYAVLTCSDSAEKLRQLCKKNRIKTKVLCGPKELVYVSSHKDCNCIMSAIVGSAALEPTFHAIRKGKKIFLANKESLIMSGDLLIKNAKKSGSIIIPVDSEHNSILQILLASGLDYKIGDATYYKEKIDEILLTASGGPFLNKNYSFIKSASFSDAIKHPKWKMGVKNSIDSASLVNKCLEVIEAHYLFDIEYEKLEIIIHPESLVHSILEFDDYTFNLNYFYNDMTIPIFNFLRINYPLIFNKYLHNKFKIKKDFSLNFFKPDSINFPILKTFNKMNKNLHENIINFNVGNEFAVKLFSMGKINFGDIDTIINKSLSIDINIKLNTINDIIIYQNELIFNLKRKIKLLQ